MPNGNKGSMHLFRFSGIDVFLHWSWFLVAAYEINQSRRYSSPIWNVLEYLGLFFIVTLHEFGHALACRQVGGNANRIVLWPLGGVAFVDPPPRPGATLWSIAAGPLVNVALLPILAGLVSLGRSSAWSYTNPDAFRLLYMFLVIDIGLLAFNILPIYPLDGGQILRSLLWFVLGRAKSLMVATSIGFVGVIGFIILAVYRRSAWLAILAAFMLMNCWGALKHARALLRLAKIPRREGFACPRCGTAPPLGNYWRCGQCSQPFDTFATGAACPHCGSQFSVTRCLDCGGMHPLHEWTRQTLATTKF
jgi:Zn-dependent protease